VSVNCAAIPIHLIESILFGHERGAFTGAIQTKKGVFEVADEGTVFLDEIGELPLAAQAVLLRVLEGGSFSRVGSSDEIHTEVRVIAATHRDLRQMVAAGSFREDLYYRLNTMILRIPPLRERKDEIEPLSLRFLHIANEANGRAAMGIAPEALAALQAYDWPGNVRELHNAIEHAVVVADGEILALHDLPEAVRTGSRVRDGSSTAAGAAAGEPVVSTVDPSGDGTGPVSGDLRLRMQEYEAAILLETLEQTNGNRTEAARRLGMSLRTLRHKIKELGLATKSE